MSAKWAFRLALVSIVAAFAIALTLMGVTAENCDKDLQLKPMIAFELAQNETDLQQIFGKPGVECVSDVAAQLDNANWYDTIGYIPAYTAFYMLIAYALGRRDRMLGGITMALALGCGVADLIENAAMFQLSPPGQALDWLMALRVATNIKWIGLGVVTTLGGVMLARQNRWGWLAVPIGIVPLAVSLWALAAPKDAGNHMINAVLFGTLALTVAAIAGSFSKDRPASA